MILCRTTGTEIFEIVCYISKGYDVENFVVARAVEEGERLNVHTLPELINHMEGQEGSCSYTFLPIHFRQRAVGFLVLKNANFL